MINKRKLVDCDILVAINSCDRDLSQLNELKKSEFYQTMVNDDRIQIIEYFRGGSEVSFDKGKLTLTGPEHYDFLYKKTYDMINWIVKNRTFNKLVKLDCNFMSYDRVKERTKQKICGLDRVEKTIYKKRGMEYTGSNGRPFLLRDFRAWLKERNLQTNLEFPQWIADAENMKYFCGKCYRISYDFAKYITTSAVLDIINDHSVVDEKKQLPFAIEDVMIGRMFERYNKGV